MLDCRAFGPLTRQKDVSSKEWLIVGAAQSFETASHLDVLEPLQVRLGYLLTAASIQTWRSAKALANPQCLTLVLNGSERCLLTLGRESSSSLASGAILQLHLEVQRSHSQARTVVINHLLAP